MKKLNILNAFIFLFLLTSCTASGISTKTDYGLGTIITVTIYDKNKEDLIDESISLMRQYENMLSRNLKNSEIAKINSSKGSFIKVSDDTASVIKRGIYYGDLSGGLFDITIGDVSKLWGFDKRPAVPDEDDLKKAVKTVNYKNIILNGNEVKLEGGGSLDLGGIAKGYIADKMAEFLRKNGVKSAIINLGGNVYTIGSKNGKPFKVGIQSPFNEGETACIVEAVDKSVVTSGIYERKFTQDKKTYHHILNPKTGFPEDNTLASVTVVSDYSVDGDALATTLFLQGEDRGLKTAEEMEGIEALFIDKNGNIKATSGLKYSK